MELTILNLVLITFVAGVVGGLVIAEAFDMDAPRRRRQKRRAKQKARHEKRMRELQKMPTFTIDKF